LQGFKRLSAELK